MESGERPACRDKTGWKLGGPAMMAAAFSFLSPFIPHGLSTRHSVGEDHAMTISFRCEKCGKQYRVPDDRIGQSAICRDCGERMRVPTPAAQSPRAESLLPILETPRPPRPPSSAVDPALVVEHVERGLGPVAGVFRDAHPRPPNIDVLRLATTAERPWEILVTAGMSQVAMAVPENQTAPAHLELMIGLPRGWPPLDESTITDARYNGPLNLLRTLARLPFESSSWLGAGHIVPNGDPLRPYGEFVPFNGVLLLPPLLTPAGFGSWFPRPAVRTDILAVIPLFAEEIQAAERRGLPWLLRKLDQANVTEQLDPERRNCGKSRWKLW